ncbi:MAG TPA: glycosyltransferase, partial [Longimicrobium sp.]|uniref:glycosyltransferase n=1 Tax=Longimicrobium sp. TaxID=2029185 RepID=UPI002ED93262
MSRVGSAGGWRRPAAATAGEGPRPRILFVVRTLNPGGAEGQLALLAAGLRRRGHPVAVLALYPGGALEPGLRAAGVQVDTPRKAGRWDVLGFSRRIAALARAYRPDLVHGYMDAGNLAALAVKAAWPRAALVWGERMSAIDLARYERFVRAAHRAVSLLARAPDLVIANSVAGAAFARARGVPAARVRVVPNGIDTERFRPCR